MTVHEFLRLFTTVKQTKKGWDVNCPAHDDKHPSLGVIEGAEGRIVLHCLGGCSVDSICRALGLELSDLFPDRAMPGRAIIKAPPIRQRTPAGIAFAFDLHALDLRQYADKVLDAAAKCDDCATWTDEDRDIAMACVGRAYAMRSRADFCEEYADHIREGRP